jgi:hypothetical protein
VPQPSFLFTRHPIAKAISGPKSLILLRQVHESFEMEITKVVVVVMMMIQVALRGAS